MVKRKGTRRGFAGDDVTETKQFQDDVVAERDESFVVEDTDSDHTLETESTVITDGHEVVTSTEVGSEEDFVAESEEGDADTINEDGRQGRRKGSRRGETETEELLEEAESHLEEVEDDLEDESENTEESEDEDTEEYEDEEREGRRKGLRRRGSRRGESVIMDEDGTTEEVDLPEPDEREGRRKGSRMGAYGGKSPEHQSSIKAAVSVAMSDRRL